MSGADIRILAADVAEEIAVGITARRYTHDAMKRVIEHALIRFAELREEPASEPQEAPKVMHA